MSDVKMHKIFQTTSYIKIRLM